MTYQAVNVNQVFEKMKLTAKYFKMQVHQSIYRLSSKSSSRVVQSICNLHFFNLLYTNFKQNIT